MKKQPRWYQVSSFPLLLVLNKHITEANMIQLQ